MNKEQNDNLASDVNNYIRNLAESAKATVEEIDVAAAKTAKLIRDFYEMQTT